LGQVGKVGASLARKGTSGLGRSEEDTTQKRGQTLLE
jgi:hypothetical protein